MGELPFRILRRARFLEYLGPACIGGVVYLAVAVGIGEMVHWASLRSLTTLLDSSGSVGG